MKVEIEIFTNDQIPEQDRQVCFCYYGDWFGGLYNEGWFEVDEGTNGFAVLAEDVSHWFYLPERDTL